MKKVSVIVPVYNVENYLEKCLDSLVNQTLKDIEIIIVNDGSKDNSQEIIDKYAKKYPKKIKSFTTENGGQGSARNYGLTKAEGKYIGYVDSDDYISLDMYEKMYNKALKSDSDIVICQNYIDEDGKIYLDQEGLNLNKHSSHIKALFGRISVCTKIYKKDILLDNNILFKTKVWYEDVAFTIKALLSANKITFINKPFYYYVKREGSTMNNSNVKRNLEILQAFDDVIDYLNAKNLYKKYAEAVEFLAIYHIYIAAITRVIRCDSDKSLKKEVIKELTEYFNRHFPDYKKNKYINLLTKNKKIIYNLIQAKQYWLVALIFKIKG